MREDERLRDRPLQQVRCGVCRAAVGVRKSSWEQTTIQWSHESLTGCWERSAADDARLFVGCTALRDAIGEAAVRGELTFPD